ncbi:MAG: hypothetical protein H0U73_06955 [Tatlockia sp.]|nr:hypothetical protein [Tatlockia sp.]
MYSHQEIQNASSQNLQDYLLQPILHIDDLKPIGDRLLILWDSIDDGEYEQLTLLENKLADILTSMKRKNKIVDSASSLQAFKPELQPEVQPEFQSVVNFFNAIPKELIHQGKIV